MSQSPQNARQPLFYGALAFAAGVGLGTHAWRPPLWWVVAAMVFAAAALYWRRQRPRLAAMISLAVVAAVGALAVQARDAAAELPEVARFTTGDEVIVTGHVVHDGMVRQGAFGDQRQSLDLETEQITA